MFYYLYKITNAVNSKIYVGVHKTKNLNDGYMGSGKIIRRAIEKHGLTNFSKDILEYFDTSKAMYTKEAEVVNEEFLLREDVYNLRRGGHGGFEYINNTPGIGVYGGTVNGCLIGGYKSFNLGLGIHSKESKLKAITACKLKLAGAYSPIIRALGNIAAMSESSKEKRRTTYSEIYHQQGEKNSQFGMMWITNEVESKKIKKTDVIPEGFRKGRVIK